MNYENGDEMKDKIEKMSPNLKKKINRDINLIIDAGLEAKKHIKNKVTLKFYGLFFIMIPFLFKLTFNILNECKHVFYYTADQLKIISDERIAEMEKTEAK